IYDIAKEVLKVYPDLLKMSQEKAISICRDFAFNMILKEIKEDLERFRVIYDSWYSEKSLYEKGKIDKVLSILKEKGLIYEKEGALWFKATAFGDEKDRVIIRSNGEYTYFASDIAYHYEKFNERKFDLCINIWGIDHHGYVPRIKGVLKGLGIDPERLKIILIQMVNLIEKGKLKSMSTRKGEFVTLKELMDDVGVDAIRFIFLSRSLEAGLDFDVELAKKQSQENPVYYVQYAHARICSVFKKAKEKGIEKIENTKINWALLSGKEEIELMKLLEEFPSVVEASALYFAPYKITYYLLDLAKNFHEFYTNYRILGEDENLTHTRLALCLACKNVFKNGLELLGVSAPEKM
ncbi:MAG: arginine--tRNA ligase, partial [Thermodesulfobacteriota bacterium]